MVTLATHIPAAAPAVGALADHWPAVGAVVLFVVIAAALAGSVLRRPAAVPAEAPTELFSALRAMAHVYEIAKAPHPTGTAEHDRVRDQLLARLTGLGLTAGIQQATVTAELPGMRPGTQDRLAGDIANVVGVLTGSAGSDRRPAVLLVAHYDSVPTGAGANDNGVAVAALLEVARVLSDPSERLRNDIVFLFTDAEEVGQLGARAFLDHHPLRDRIGVVLNFEARGSRGPVLMFETGAGNAWTVSLLGGVVRRGYVSSLFQEVYRKLPNMTDFTVFADAGLPGFNFAYIDGYTHYHSATDTPETVDHRSLQHHGEYALGLTRRLGRADLSEATGRPNATFFSLPGGRLVHYPAGWAVRLTVAITAVWLITVGVGLSGSWLSPGRVALGSLASAAPAGLLVALVPRWGSPLISGAPEFAYYGHVGRGGRAYLAGIAAGVVAAHAALDILSATPLGALDLAVGASLWWLVLCWLTALWLPAAAYLPLWPLLCATLGLTVPTGTGYGPWPEIAALSVMCLVPIFLVGPLVPLTFTALSARLAVVPGLVVSLLCGLLTIPLGTVATSLGWPLPAAAAGLAAGCLAVARWANRAGRPQQHFHAALYALAGDTGTAVSAVAGDDHDAPRTAGAAGHGDTLPQLFPGSRQRFRSVPAPALALATPEISVLREHRREDRRTIELRLVSARDAPEALVSVTGTAVLGYAVDGVAGRCRPDPPGQDWTLWLYALPPGGRTLTLTVPHGRPFRLRLTDRTTGLPEEPGSGPPPALPAPALGKGLLCNSTYVSNSLAFH